MNLIRSLVVTLLVSAVSGCISFPSTPDSFRTSAVGKLEFAVDKPLRESYTLVAENSIRCHQGNMNSMATVRGASFIFPTGSTRIEGKIDDGDGRATIAVHFSGVTADGLLQVIDFQRATESKTDLTVYRLNDTKKWRTATDAVKAWFDGGKDCYGPF